MKFNLRLPSFVLFATETKDVDVLKVKEGSYLLAISASGRDAGTWEWRRLPPPIQGSSRPRVLCDQRDNLDFHALSILTATVVVAASYSFVMSVKRSPRAAVRKARRVASPPNMKYHKKQNLVKTRKNHGSKSDIAGWESQLKSIWNCAKCLNVLVFLHFEKIC